VDRPPSRSRRPRPDPRLRLRMTAVLGPGVSPISLLPPIYAV
jgi:hypothetical protein